MGCPWLGIKPQVGHPWNSGSTPNLWACICFVVRFGVLLLLFVFVWYGLFCFLLPPLRAARLFCFLYHKCTWLGSVQGHTKSFVITPYLTALSSDALIEVLLSWCFDLYHCIGHYILSLFQPELSYCNNLKALFCFGHEVRCLSYSSCCGQFQCSKQTKLDFAPSTKS